MKFARNRMEARWLPSRFDLSFFRLFAYLALFALTTRFMILPLWGRVSDERVALYLEESEPSLQAAVLSAVEVGHEKPASERPGVSRALVERLVETAVGKCQTIDFGRPAAAGNRPDDPR